jgi:hypothetical protein
MKMKLKCSAFGAKVRIDTKCCSSGKLAREGVWMMGVPRFSAFVKHFTDKTIKKSQIFLFFIF